MSPNGLSCGFSKTIIFSSSESSDSESFLHEDVKSSGNLINKQWEVIERTLYQEPGQQVTDPALLKECKLWRETFPHFRVKGTKIDVKKSGNEVKEIEKNVQTLQKHFNLKKLEEKRESIKKKVVETLVERLISKYGLEKEESANSEFNKNFKPGVKITEIVDETSSKFSTKNTINKSVQRNSESSVVVSTDKESYFERGKEPDKKPDKKPVCEDEDYISIAEMEKNLYEIFDSWENDCKSVTKLPKTCDSKKVDNLAMKCVEKPTPGRFKPIKATSSNALADLAKPFEITKKIDKRYEGLIEKIMERKQNEFDTICHCRKSASGLEIKSYQETLEKLRKGSGFDEYVKRKEMPKINKLQNNWLKRNEMNYFTAEDDLSPKKTPSAKLEKVSKNLNLSRDDTQDEPDKKFVELKKEITLNFKRPAKKTGAFEGINLQRSKPYASSAVKTLKSSSHKDLYKKNKKETNDRQLKSRLEMAKSESSLKNHVKQQNLKSNRGSKSNAIQNSLLPPIETEGFPVREMNECESSSPDERRYDCKSEENLTELLTTFKSRWPVEEWKKFGFYNDDYLLKINIYWLKFPPPSPSSHYILGALYIVIMIIGIIGNFLIIIMFMRKRSLRTPSNIFIMNLAISDALLLLKMPLFIFNSFYLGPVLGSVGCSIYGFVGGLTGTVSIMTLAAIAFDRYQVIVHPLARKTRIMIYLQILLIWFYGIFFSTIPLLDIGLNKYVPEGYLTACSFDYLSKDLPSRVTIFVFFVAAWVVPICIIIGSYAAMYRVIFKGLKGRINKLTRHCKEMEMRRTELKVAVMVISVISLWTLSWTPYAVVALMGVTGHEKYLTPTSSMIPALFCKTASCIDPYVYAITNPRFRTELRRDLQRTPRIQASIKTMDKKEFWTIAEETAERGRAMHRESMDEIIVLATSVRNNF